MKREQLKQYTSSEIEEIDDALLVASEDGTIKMTRVYIASDADSVMDGYEQRIKKLEAENARLKAQVPVWHSVTDGDLPPKYKPVLVRYNYDTGHSYEEHFTVEMYIGEEWNNLRNYDEQPTHWMPLPPPPTEESSATEMENG